MKWAVTVAPPSVLTPVAVNVVGTSVMLQVGPVGADFVVVASVVVFVSVVVVVLAIVVVVAGVVGVKGDVKARVEVVP